MLILAVDSSSKQSSVCILQDEKPIFKAVQQANVTHSQNLLPMITSALEICGVNKTEIDLFAVTIGPGSFTGLRIGTALIKGMAAALNKPCVGVSSLEALYKSVELCGTIIPCFDARRGQVYCCVFENGEKIQQDVCIMAQELDKFVSKSKKNVFFVGDGKEICYNIYGNLSNVIKHSENMPCIAYGAALLALSQKPITQFEISPSYLRLSQAEQELKEKNNDSFSC